MNNRSNLKDKKRIIIKIGSSSLAHPNTGFTDLSKLEKLVRVLSNLNNSGKEVILVSSGAISAGKRKLGASNLNTNNSSRIAFKQACAAVGQAQLMMMYEKLFAEYNQVSAQILMTKNTILNNESRYNAANTFHELLDLGVIPVVNENDTVSTYEIKFGDNDRLSAIVTALVNADLLILLSDIDGLFTDDPHQNKDAKFISCVEQIDERLMHMGKSTSGSDVGTGGMEAKIAAAQIATASGADMVIANGNDVHVIESILSGEDVGTLFCANKNDNFDLIDCVEGF